MKDDHFAKIDYASLIFDPMPSYDGKWFFSIDNLIINASILDGENLFLKYYYDTYEKRILDIFKNPRILEEKAYLVSMPNENKIGRCLKYSKVHFYSYLISLLNYNIDNYKLSKEEVVRKNKRLIHYLSESAEKLNKKLEEELDSKLLKLKDILDKEIESVYFESAMKDYEIHKYDIDFTTYIEEEYEYIKSIKEGITKLDNFFDYNLDYHELSLCFSPSKFTLLFAKIIYDDINYTHNLNGYYYLMYYKKILLSIKLKDKSYKEVIKYYLPNGIVKKYTNEDYLKDYLKLFTKNRLKDINIPSKNEVYKDITFMETLDDLYDEDILKYWQMMVNEDIFNKDEDDELFKKIKTKIKILKNSGFILYPLKGKGIYNNYFAFTFPTGIMVIEHIFNDDGNTILLNSPTYVLTLKEFLEMTREGANFNLYSKTSKTIKRIFYTNLNKWQTDLYEEVSMMDKKLKLKEVLELIDSYKGDKDE